MASVGESMSSERWMEQRNRENMILFYGAELRQVHLTHSAQHLNPGELQRFREEGWIVCSRQKRYPYTYRLSDEVVKTLRLEE